LKVIWPPYLTRILFWLLDRSNACRQNTEPAG
jgi:hypothetical protein